MNESCHPTLTKAQLVTPLKARNDFAITKTGEGFTKPVVAHAFESYPPLLTTMCAVLPSVFRHGTLQGQPSFTLEQWAAQ